MLDINKKQCTKCKRWLPSNEENFYRAKNYRDGLKSWCKKCQNDHRREYQRSDKFKAYRYNKQGGGNTSDAAPKLTYKEATRRVVIAYGKLMKELETLSKADNPQASEIRRVDSLRSDLDTQTVSEQGAAAENTRDNGIAS
jgi:hypothetical protein